MPGPSFDHTIDGNEDAQLKFWNLNTEYEPLNHTVLKTNVLRGCNVRFVVLNCFVSSSMINVIDIALDRIRPFQPLMRYEVLRCSVVLLFYNFRRSTIAFWHSTLDWTNNEIFEVCSSKNEVLTFLISAHRSLRQRTRLNSWTVRFNFLKIKVSSFLPCWMHGTQKVVAYSRYLIAIVVRVLMFSIVLLNKSHAGRRVLQHQRIGPKAMLEVICPALPCCQAIWDSADRSYSSSCSRRGFDSSRNSP